MQHNLFAGRGFPALCVSSPVAIIGATEESSTLIGDRNYRVLH